MRPSERSGELSRAIELNPKADPGLVVQALDAIVWRDAPLLAAAWIAVGVELLDEAGKPYPATVGCWYLDDGGQRIPALNYGVHLEEGQVLLIRRPGSLDGPYIMERIRAMLWQRTGMNGMLVIDPPDPHYVPPERLEPTKLARALARAIHSGERAHP